MPTYADRGTELDFIAIWNDYQMMTYATGKAAGFYDHAITTPEQHLAKIALMHSELSEACEGIRGDLMDDKLPHRKMVECELADTVIRIMNYAKHTGLDVAGAIVEKNLFNRTRPRKHGKLA